MAESPHAEFIATPTELYTLLNTLGAVSHRPPLLAPYYDINTSAAEAAYYTSEAVSLMRDLPYLDVELYDRVCELKPNTYLVSYLSAADKGDFESLHEMLHDEFMPSTALRLTFLTYGLSLGLFLPGVSHDQSVQSPISRQASFSQYL